MKRTILVTALVLFGASFSTMGCSRAAVMCEVICDCEHCNDQNNVERCNQLGTAEDVADAYDCSDKWDAYTVCFEERGQCDVTEARFSTRNEAGDDVCQKESDDLEKCVDDASAHEGTSGAFN